MEAGAAGRAGEAQRLVDVEPVADGEARPLDPRWIEVERIAGGIFAAVLSVMSLVGVVVLVAAVDDMPVWLSGLLPVLWVVAAVLLGWLAHRWPVIAYRHTSYRVDARGIEIRRGVFWRSAIHVPRSRVQHTDVSQGPLERRYDLGTLVIFTAGTDHARIDLPGLAHDVALRLREHFRPGDNADAV
ncbi:MAG TPA: PH domain-containing protein [Vicinamibacterales bacterium]|nr:PH domain-containing protein [Vicinamibacterales bacterium]